MNRFRSVVVLVPVVALVTSCTTPLSDAVRRGDVAAAGRLLEAGNRDINQPQGKRRATPLYEAAERGYAQIVALLLRKGANVEAATVEGWTPLMVGAEKGDADVCEALLAAGACVHQTNVLGGTPLAVAVYNERTEVVRMLLAKGADGNHQDQRGFTSLHLAAQVGNVEIARQLLAAGADVESTTRRRVTPLNVAAAHDQGEVFEMLLEHGAKPNRAPQVHVATAKTFLLLAERSKQEGNRPAALEAWRIAEEEFRHEAQACERAVRVQQQQAAHEAFWNAISLVLATASAYGMAASSPLVISDNVGVGIGYAPQFHTVDPMYTASFAERAQSCLDRAAFCRARILELEPDSPPEAGTSTRPSEVSPTPSTQDDP